MAKSAAPSDHGPGDVDRPITRGSPCLAMLAHHGGEAVKMPSAEWGESQAIETGNEIATSARQLAILRLWSYQLCWVLFSSNHLTLLLEADSRAGMEHFGWRFLLFLDYLFLASLRIDPLEESIKVCNKMPYLLATLSSNVPFKRSWKQTRGSEQCLKSWCYKILINLQICSTL
jgi:hypothetical protein